MTHHVMLRCVPVHMTHDCTCRAVLCPYPQLWGDKIRRASTWWTWGLMGLQITSFVAVLSVLEPRRAWLIRGQVCVCGGGGSCLEPREPAR